MSSAVTAKPAFNLGEGLLNTANTGIISYFGYRTAKETSKTLANAPQGNTLIIVGGVVAIAIVGLIAVKSFT